MESLSGKRDRVAAFFRETTPRRLLALSIFVGLLILFRHLMIMLVFFVIFERLFGPCALWLARALRIHHKVALTIFAVLLVAGVVVGVAFGIGHIVRVLPALRENLPGRIEALKETPLFQEIAKHMKDADKLVDGINHYAVDVLGYLNKLGHFFIYALIGFILAIVFRLEHQEIQDLRAAMNPRSLTGTLVRWFNYLSDATLVTLQFQMVVAACNTALTLPVVLFLGLRHVAGLMLMIFLSGLIPVVGNFISGAVLCFLAFQSRGWIGVGVFLVLTFILHKLESYYLNPRLAARHVRLPGFVLILSLIAWEHLLGFVGLFISFPILYIATRVRDEFRAEDREEAEASV